MSLLAVLFLGFIFAGIIGCIVLLLFQRRISKSIRIIDDDLDAVEARISKYRDHAKYMLRKERVGFGERLVALDAEIALLKRDTRFLSTGQRILATRMESRAIEMEDFLGKYNAEYVKREVERRRPFFASHGFDKEQTEAIVKTDNYNLIVAAAGSGKTRTLTGRYAFLVESGVNQSHILALAYTKSAAKEMENRLYTDYGIRNPNVRTFHSIGRELLRGSVNFRSGIAKDPKRRKIIAESLKRLSQNGEFASRLLDFAVKWQTPELTLESFETKEKYYAFLRNQKYTTLESKQVNSIAERDIANFLILNQVKFEHEKTADWADASEKFRQYEPDFYLPEYDIWIEHFGIDRDGKVAPWFSKRGKMDPTESYRESMKWKRSQFEKHKRKLIETYHFQWAEDTLTEELKRKLLQNGVILRELPKEAILDHVQKLIPTKDQLNELMFSFISKAKTNALTISETESRLKSGDWSRAQRAFTNLMLSIWRDYEESLKDENMIDFPDMINLTLDIARKESRTIHHFPHILVDEFQDITDPQLELLSHLVTKDPGSTLFCVGDYRQNIFSFAGSDINNILEFEKLFPYAETTDLSTNYRSPKNVVDASNLVAGLSRQKRGKEVVAASSLESPIALLEKSEGRSFPDYEQWEFGKARELIEHLIRSKKPQERILVLARTNYSLNRLKMEFPNSDSAGLRFLTIHRAKGLEADYVLLLNCTKGPYGFPSDVFDNKLLEIVKKGRAAKAEKIEEERRLFYVALTRTRGKFFIFSSKLRKSQFVYEIGNYLVDYLVPAAPVNQIGQMEAMKNPSAD